MIIKCTVDAQFLKTKNADDVSDAQAILDVASNAVLTGIEYRNPKEL